MTEQTLDAYLETSLAVMAATRDARLGAAMGKAIEAISGALAHQKPVLVCGNGGSMADAMHIAGELAARFLVDRPALQVMALGTNVATLTAWSNDVSYDSLFAREVEAYGASGGVLLGISTSGNSGNVVAAMEQAGAMGMTRVSMTGEGGGKLAGLSDVLLAVPSRFTPHIQQVHQVLYHYLCLEVEARSAAVAAMVAAS